MGSYSVFITQSAVREIDGLPTAKIRRAIVQRIMGLGEDPRPRGCTKLSGADKYRLRQGRYRIVYSIQDDRLIVIVVRVAHRKDVVR